MPYSITTVNYRIIPELWEKAGITPETVLYKDGFQECENKLVPILQARDKQIEELRKQIQALNKEWKEELDNVKGQYQEQASDMRDEMRGNNY